MLTGKEVLDRFDVPKLLLAEMGQPKFIPLLSSSHRAPTLIQQGRQLSARRLGLSPSNAGFLEVAQNVCGMRPPSACQLLEVGRLGFSDATLNRRCGEANRRRDELVEEALLSDEHTDSHLNSPTPLTEGPGEEASPKVDTMAGPCLEGEFGSAELPYGVRYVLRPGSIRLLRKETFGFLQQDNVAPGILELVLQVSMLPNLGR
eukprot:s5196_g3.t1